MGATTLSPVFSYGQQLLDEFKRRDHKPEPIPDPRAESFGKDIAELDDSIHAIEKSLGAEQQMCSALQAEYDKSVDRDKMAHLVSRIQVSKSIIGRSQAELQREQEKRAGLTTELSATRAKHEAALAEYETSRAIDAAKGELQEIDARILQDLKRRREIVGSFRYTKFYSENDEKHRAKLEEFSVRASSLFEFSVLAGTVGQCQGVAHIAHAFSRYFSVQDLKF
jgi:hypothetical protein